MLKSIDVNIEVDAGRILKSYEHNWRYIGYDECNYTDTPGGKELLRSFGNLADAPYYIRTHHLLCTGNCLGTYKWGSTNVYTEDENGNPVYNFEVFDSIIDTILKTNNKPFMELGFMPLDLLDPSLFAECDKFSKYGHYVNKAHTYPPKNYNKWADLVAVLAKHCVERYGEQEVLTWYWELWNEPDLPYYWNGTIEEYCKLYDYTEASLHSVLPLAKLGGPATTGPEIGKKSVEYLKTFLSHCRNGVNYVDGSTGTRLDYITFHVKGGGFAFDLNAKKENPSVKTLIDQVITGLETIKELGYGNREVVLSEADPDGWAAGGIYDNPNFNFRNTEYYASFIASSYNHINRIASYMNMDVRPVAWSFMFNGERCFEGTRTFSTQGIKKASFNTFRVLSKLGSKRLFFKSSQEKDILSYKNLHSEDEDAELSGSAAINDEGNIQILLFSHHDDVDRQQNFDVNIEINNLPFTGNIIVKQYRIDSEHSNAYAEWVKQGKPKYPDEKEYAKIKAKDGLEQVGMSEKQTITEGRLKLQCSMPAHAVSLIEIISRK